MHNVLFAFRIVWCIINEEEIREKEQTICKRIDELELVKIQDFDFDIDTNVGD